MNHYGDVIMGEIASQIASLAIVYSTVYSEADQRKHQSIASLAFVRGIHRSPVNSPHKWPVTRKMFPFDDVIMILTVLPREQRKCPRCNKIDDEYHFLLECCILKDLHTQLIPAYYWKRPSMFKCIQLLKSSDKTLNKLAKYVYRGFMLKSWIAMLVTIFGLPWFSCMLYCMYSV